MTDRKFAGACACKQVARNRRSLLTSAAALLLSPFSPALAQANARMMKPQAGDGLVFAHGPRKGEPVMVDDLKVGDHPTSAYPRDPSGTMRDGSRINLLILVRLRPEDLAEKALARAAEGVVAYSAVCTHYGCPITLTHTDGKAVVCTCHGSTFDVSNNGEIVAGPATRRLANLPLKAVDGALVVAAGFSGQLGPPQQ